jgi:predicted HicB family RNase H-like nuclease
MTNDLLQYKGYFGSIQYSAEDRSLYGKIEFIDDLVLYEGQSVPEVEAAFQSAVEDYLQSCADAGTDPNVTCKGSFNVRVGEKLHRDLAVEAMRNQQSLNEFIRSTLHERIYGSVVRKDLENIVAKLPAMAAVLQLRTRQTQWNLNEAADDSGSFVSKKELTSIWTH